jgi:hypothetical protein
LRNAPDSESTRHSTKKQIHSRRADPASNNNPGKRRSISATRGRSKRRDQSEWRMRAGCAELHQRRSFLPRQLRGFECIRHCSIFLSVNAMFQPLQRSNQFLPESLNRFFITMLPIFERRPETEHSRKAKWRKQYNQRVKVARPAEVMKYCRRQRPPRPFLSLRPVQNNSTLFHQRQDVCRHIFVPYRAIGIHEQDVFSSWQPQCPDE